jgi:peptidoglycan/LPS O-acetylase OafA/YrhL
MLTYKKKIFLLLFVILVLLIPFISMQYTKEVNWSFFDFVVAGGLLFGTGLTIDYVFRNVKNKRKRNIICFIVLFLLFLLWLELAVGIFNSSIAGN